MIKSRIPECHIREETEVEKEHKAAGLRKNNSPGPLSYKTTEARRVSTFHKKDKALIFEKSPKRSFLDNIVSKKKQLPGVGKYDVGKSLDYCYKPSRKY